MESKDPTVFTKTYEEGVERVLKVMEQDLDLEKDILRICILEDDLGFFSKKIQNDTLYYMWIYFVMVM